MTRILVALTLTELNERLEELNADGVKVVSAVWDGARYVIVTAAHLAGGPYDGTEQR